MKRDTDITILLDRSGSMHAVTADTIGGFNTFLAKQQEHPDAKLTLIQFDDQYEPVYVGRSIEDAKPLTPDTFVPRGSTALYDAICRSIDETGARLEKIAKDQRPALVIFVILTDGYENASKQRNVAAINERIRRQRDEYNWQFVYLGANQDAIASAGAIGIAAGSSMNYAASPRGIIGAYAAMSLNVARARGDVRVGASVPVAAERLNWTQEQRQEQDKEIDLSKP